VIVLLQVLGVVAESDRSPLVFHRVGFQRLHREDLDPSRLHGRLNGEPVDSDSSVAGTGPSAPDAKDADDRDAT